LIGVKNGRNNKTTNFFASTWRLRQGVDDGSADDFAALRTGDAASASFGALTWCHCQSIKGIERSISSFGGVRLTNEDPFLTITSSSGLTQRFLKVQSLSMPDHRQKNNGCYLSPSYISKIRRSHFQILSRQPPISSLSGLVIFSSTRCNA
jgi:hypothetical protein